MTANDARLRYILLAVTDIDVVKYQTCKVVCTDSVPRAVSCVVSAHWQHWDPYVQGYLTVANPP